MSPSLGTNLTRQHGNPFMVAISNDIMRVSFEMQLLATGACRYHELEGVHHDSGIRPTPALEKQRKESDLKRNRGTALSCPFSPP